MTGLSWVTIGVCACVVIGIFVVMKSFAMPQSFFKKQEKKEELLKKYPPEQPPPAA